MVGRDSDGYERFGGRFIAENIRTRLFRKAPPETVRTVYVDNQLLSSDEVVTLSAYPDNRVVSSKYTLLNFLPKNLFEQFRRIANFYFLVVGVIQFMIDTPVTPITSVLPLVFVISVTAIKQGYEDWLRHRADKEVNVKPATVIRGGSINTKCMAMDIKVGDIVKVNADEEFPCDLVILSSSDPQGLCYITTANLDGETNLKTHYCLPETRKFRTPEELGNLRARISCKPAIADLYTFEGVMDINMDSNSKSLGPDNLLLRGARLKNTEYIFAVAVFTGRDTKMALNSKFKQTKFSRVERKMNTFLIVFLVTLLCQSGLCTALKYWYESDNPHPWYVVKEDVKNKGVKGIENFLAFMVIFNYIIPISLYVTIEMQKFIGSLFFGWDCMMFDETINERAQANTSDLNEELGQVEYLFTDKTGTLTENTMEFRQCLMGNRQFENVDGRLAERHVPEEDPEPVIHFTSEMERFIQVLVLCHTVRVDKPVDRAIENGASSVYSSTGDDYDYQASSPDEKALVKACCRYGFVYHGTRDDCMEVTFQNKMRRFKLLHSLPFDPVRKRMSIILETEEGEKILMCKGAEVAVLDRVKKGEITTTERMINNYAKLGLRTLTIAEKRLSQDEYLTCDLLLNEAKTSLSQRQQKLSEAYDVIERDLTLLGATAVEDKLQEKVPETIDALRQAGIKVWVLTGDKEETAVNISHSAGHFHPGMSELRLTQVTSAEQCTEQIKHLFSIISNSFPNTEHALIIDGQTLLHALLRHKEQLRKLCQHCTAVLCCRMSPLQKAEVVGLIKSSKEMPVTAAIGDGANDVSMIQEADVGLGIMGKEGRQAVRNSDYAFGKFRFLQQVLLVHGHLYYNRIAVLVQYFFYKNIAWISSQFYFAFFTFFSQQSLFDPFFLIFYNITFTSLPILIYGLFEQHKPKKILISNPRLYRNVTKNASMSWREFIKWNALGVWHSCVFFFGVMLYRLQDVSMFSDGLSSGYMAYGSIVYFTCCIAVNLKLMLETYYWCIATLFGYVITFLALIFMPMVYINVWWPSWMVDGHDMYKVLGQLLSSASVWLTMLFLIVLALLPDVLIRTVRDMKWSRELAKKTSTLEPLSVIRDFQRHSSPSPTTENIELRTATNKDKEIQITNNNSEDAVLAEDSLSTNPDEQITSTSTNIQSSANSHQYQYPALTAVRKSEKQNGGQGHVFYDYHPESDVYEETEQNITKNKETENNTNHSTYVNQFQNPYLVEEYSRTDQQNEQYKTQEVNTLKTLEKSSSRAKKNIFDSSSLGSKDSSGIATNKQTSPLSNLVESVKDNSEVVSNSNLKVDNQIENVALLPGQIDQGFINPSFENDDSS